MPKKLKKPTKEPTKESIKEPIEKISAERVPAEQLYNKFLEDNKLSVTPVPELMPRDDGTFSLIVNRILVKYIE